MGIFNRRKRERDETVTDPTGTDHPEPVEGAPSDTDSETPAPAPFERTSGPWDRSEVDSVEDHIDLGALLLRGVEGMELRLELDQAQSQVVAATAVLGESTLQMQAFAAPRSGGLWAEIRDEIAGSVVQRGGTAELVEGAYGTELHTRVPTDDGSGRTVFAPARFLGVDGPRWFLRGVLAGRAAIDDTAAAPLLDFFGRAVVLRGEEPMPPRELLALTLPSMPETSADPVDAAGESSPGSPGAAPDGRRVEDLNPFERGPEITEVR